VTRKASLGAQSILADNVAHSRTLQLAGFSRFEITSTHAAEKISESF
jgi:hypothetical protein